MSENLNLQDPSENESTEIDRDAKEAAAKAQDAASMSRFSPIWSVGSHDVPPRLWMLK